LPILLKASKRLLSALRPFKSYLDYLSDSFLIHAALRYDIKGKKYIDTPLKYYFTDLGLRNARLNFRQLEENHTLENVIYNELLTRGYNVDVGVVTLSVRDKEGKLVRKQLEVDFVCNQASKRYYIQSAFVLPDTAKLKQEQQSLLKIDDTFKKIIIVKDTPAPWYTEAGVLVLSSYDFLLDVASLEK
jgi:predicted AAA+ superfamily ATPase